MSETVTMNLNDCVEVSLTSAGRQAVYKANAFYRTLGVKGDMFPAEGGKLKALMWQLMNVFGAGMCTSSPPVFENSEIRILKMEKKASTPCRECEHLRDRLRDAEAGAESRAKRAEGAFRRNGALANALSIAHVLVSDLAILGGTRVSTHIIQAVADKIKALHVEAVKDAESAPRLAEIPPQCRKPVRPFLYCVRAKGHEGTCDKVELARAMCK